MDITALVLEDSSESSHCVEHWDALLLLIRLPLHAGQRLQPAQYLHHHPHHPHHPHHLIHDQYPLFSYEVDLDGFRMMSPAKDDP